MLIVLVLLGYSLALPIADLIETTFPNCSMSSHMFSGYLPLIPGKKELHYIFTESQDRFNWDPLMVWLGGGPGCSALEWMFLSHGPCVVNDDDNGFFDNPFAWNARMNVLYIDGPSGVGFSLGKDPENRRHNDYTYADDNMNALLEFYKKFPEYIGWDIYIAADSYGGVYAPFMAMRIL